MNRQWRSYIPCCLPSHFPPPFLILFNSQTITHAGILFSSCRDKSLVAVNSRWINSRWACNLLQMAFGCMRTLTHRERNMEKETQTIKTDSATVCKADKHCYSDNCYYYVFTHKKSKKQNSWLKYTLHKFIPFPSSRTFEIEVHSCNNKKLYDSSLYFTLIESRCCLIGLHT